MTIPNLITLFRIFAAPAVYLTLAYYRLDQDSWRVAAFFIFLAASVTDALDGFIVRRWKMGSELGTFLDPLADKLLLICAFVGIYNSALDIKPPLWVIIIVVFRELFIVAGLVVVFFTTHAIHIKPNLLGKMTTFFQMLTILFVLLQFKIASLFWLLIAALTLVSGTVYILREMRRFSNGKNFKPGSPNKKA